MRELRVVFTVLALFALSSKGSCSDVLGKDGFNYYKDYLRAGRADEIIPGASADQMIYFYRTPLQLYPGFLPAVEQEYRKRTGNAFKNHMLSKDIDEESIPENKRGSKTALSFMMGSKQGPFHNNNVEVPNEEFVLTPAE